MSAPDPALYGAALADDAGGAVRQSVENGPLDRLWPSP